MEEDSKIQFLVIIIVWDLKVIVDILEIIMIGLTLLRRTLFEEELSYLNTSIVESSIENLFNKFTLHFKVFLIFLTTYK